MTNWLDKGKLDDFETFKVLLNFQQGQMIDQNSLTQIFICPADTLQAYFHLPERVTWAKAVTLIITVWKAVLYS